QGGPDAGTSATRSRAERRRPGGIQARKGTNRRSAAAAGFRFAQGGKREAVVARRRSRRNDPSPQSETCPSASGFRRPQSTNSTGTPGFTSLASSAASQLVRRTQPWLWVLPIFDGSGVP